MVIKSNFCHGLFMNQRLSIDALRALLSVIDTGSMTRAAHQLNLSQSAVSWKIKRLEEQLGRRLVDRQGMTLTATADGEALLSHGRQILQAHDRALAHFSPSLLQGRVRFGATEQMSLPQLAALLAAFTHQHPQVDVQLVIEQSQVLRNALDQGTLDLVLHQQFCDALSAEDVVLATERIHWCVPPGWRYQSGDRVKLVSYGPDCFYRRLAEERLSAAGIACQVSVECPSVAGMLAAIAAGMGIGLLNQQSIDRRVQIETRLERLLPLPSVAHALRLGAKRHHPLLQTLQQQVVQALGPAAVP
ncbi:LysR family transcriptional regulator [Serratia proteamaculans]|uniref:LysR family transcriptional regulator n=1 Tax=Serratia proteamaculans TaxID=28151 RepID=A0A7U0N8F3_SERPR|nr:LysR family transcriptional regulator [Serratia proteamaculans]MBO1501429.1 LysR family transcriptional regulator [Serratia proteamaculans]MDW5509489.1 LysR family transcriptional regulator [Serratia proteamaculans]QQX54435.1 LysR family transcriptional regulator [Serratia proteamaculans]HCV66859.1 LysR family transcriptional regulator [Serratia sp. (in: enterobacteria)]